MKEPCIEKKYIATSHESCLSTPMPEWVTNKVADALNERGEAVEGSRVLLLCVAYRKNVVDMRESSPIHLMDMIVKSC